MSAAQAISDAMTLGGAIWIVVGVLGYRRRVREARERIEASDPPFVN